MRKKTAQERNRELVAFGLAVQKRRREMGLSQEKAAERAGIHRTYFADVERGTRNVGLKNLIAIARALGITPSALLHSIQ